LFSPAGIVALAGVLVSVAPQTSSPDAEGFIHNRLALAPIPVEEESKG
jgi:hypothetical protein